MGPIVLFLLVGANLKQTLSQTTSPQRQTWVEMITETAVAMPNREIAVLMTGSPQSGWSENPADPESVGALERKSYRWLSRPECLPDVLKNQERYICNEKGDLVCLGGWAGAKCDKPICHGGCGDQGKCVGPGKCRCHVGYYGDQCEKCIPLPGCKHGSCNKAYECNCFDGWKGTYCKEPVCKKGCNLDHATCQYPGECSCNPGMLGPNCDGCVKAPGCVHGTCARPFQCNCKEGWTGVNCDQPTCNVNCLHGKCWVPNECRCDVGWKGNFCDECTPYPGCVNGYCLKPNECQCVKGFYGMYCNETTPIKRFSFTHDSSNWEEGDRGAYSSFYNSNKFGEILINADEGVLYPKRDEEEGHGPAWSHHHEHSLDEPGFKTYKIDSENLAKIENGEETGGEYEYAYYYDEAEGEERRKRSVGDVDFLDFTDEVALEQVRERRDAGGKLAKRGTTRAPKRKQLKKKRTKKGAAQL